MISFKQKCQFQVKMLVSNKNACFVNLIDLNEKISSETFILCFSPIFYLFSPTVKFLFILLTYLFFSRYLSKLTSILIFVFL